MKAFVKEITWLSRNIPLGFGLDFGWGNGYIIISKGHPLYGKDCDEIYNLMPELDVHGGLTFSKFANELDWPELNKKDKNGWIIGFDTVHLEDNLENWPYERVIEETERLKKQLENYNKK